MHSSFQKLFDEIESQRKRILNSIGHLTEEQLNKSPAPGKWSISEIISHLITAERMSLRYIEKKMLGVTELPDTGLWEEVKMNLLKVSQRFPALKFKAPKMVVDRTQFFHDLTTLTKEWQGARNDFLSFLEKLPDEYVKRRVYRHVFAGYLNIKHCLLFFREHTIHHTPQIKKLVNKN